MRDLPEIAKLLSGSDEGVDVDRKYSDLI